MEEDKNYSPVWDLIAKVKKTSLSDIPYCPIDCDPEPGMVLLGEANDFQKALVIFIGNIYKNNDALLEEYDEGSVSAGAAYQYQLNCDMCSLLEEMLSLDLAVIYTLPEKCSNMAIFSNWKIYAFTEDFELPQNFELVLG